MPYDVKINLQVQGTDQLGQIEAAMHKVQASTSATSAEVKFFEQALRAYVSTGLTVSESLKQMAQESSGMSTGIRALASEFKNLSAAGQEAAATVEKVSAVHAHAVTQIAAVGGAVRTAFGEQSIRSVENFLATTLGLGPALQAIFPITGGIALAEMLGHLFEKYDPLIQAQKELAKSTKKLDEEYAALGRRLESLQINELTERFGKAAGQKLAAFYSDTNLAEDKARIRTLSREIDDAQAKLGTRSTVSTLLGIVPGLSGAAEIANRFKASAQTDVNRLTDERDFLQQKTVVDARQTSDDRAKIAKDEIEEAKARAREAKAAQREITEQLRQSDEEALAELKSSHELSVGEIIQYWEKRLRAENSNADRSREIRIKLGNLDQESDKAIQKVAEAGRKLIEAEAKKTEKALSDIEAFADDADKLLRESQAKFTANLNAIDAAKAKGDEISAVGALNQQRSAIARRTSLASSQDKVSAGIQGIQDEAAIDRQIAEVKIADEQRILDTKEKGTKDYIDQQNKILEITLSTNQKIYDDNTRVLQAIHAEREKELQSFKTGVGSVFDALVSGSSKNITNVFKGLALGQAKTIVENLAATEFDSIRNAIPRAAGGSKLGDALKGTVFGPDPLTTAGATLNTAGVKLSVAADKLLQAGGGAAGTIGAGASGIGSIFGGSTSSPFVFNAVGGGNSTGPLGEDGLPTFNNPVYSKNAFPSFSGPSSGFGLNARTIGGLTAAGGGAFAAFSDFRSGGAKNDVAGVGAALGSAAGVAALFGPAGAPVALGLGIAAAATSFISSLFPDQKKIREQQIQKTLEQNKYYAPESVTRQQNTSGNFVDFDARGNLRQSAFRAVPQVSEPYQFFKGSTAYDVPGSTTSPYSPNVTINIHANDASSFVDMARRSSSGLADVIADHVQGSEGRLSQAIAYRVAR